MDHRPKRHLTITGMPVDVLGMGRVVASVDSIVPASLHGVAGLMWHVHLRLPDGSAMTGRCLGDGRVWFDDPRIRPSPGRRPASDMLSRDLTLPNRRRSMSTSSPRDASTGVADNFTATAADYDAVVRHNIQGAHRLVASLPADEYRRVLDVGCGTGWSALAMVQRFPSVTRLTGIDPAQGMLDVFAQKLPELPGVEVDLRAEDVMAMSVDSGGYDAVISSMAMHWFPDKAGAAVAMADAMAPGGVLGILCSGAGGEHEFRQVLKEIDPPVPAGWDAAFDFVQRDVADMEAYLLDAGLEPLDIWMERRTRHSTPEAYMERMRVVASHISAGELDEQQVAELLERVLAGLHAVSGARGFRYTFTKLFAVARKPT